MIYLAITIIADVIGVFLLGKAQGFEQKFYLAAGLFSMIVGFVAFSFATKSMSVAVANTLWGGLSAVLVVMCAFVFVNEKISPLQLVCLTMVIIGAIGLHYFEAA